MTKTQQTKKISIDGVPLEDWNWLMKTAPLNKNGNPNLNERMRQLIKKSRELSRIELK